jgi:Na+-transporting NADH:ubiquinone oxidoreductase subunit C
MNDNRAYIVGFAMLVTAICVGAVSSLNHFLAPRKAANRELASQRVILELGDLVKPGQSLTPEQGREIFANQVRTITLAPLATEEAAPPLGPTINVFLITSKSDEPVAIVPVTGAGFWDQIAGYIALNLEKQIISGLRFTQQAETPGLGARIEEDWFLAQFVGRPFNRPDADGRRLRLVPSGTKSTDTQVDAITGATETSRSVENLLNRSLHDFMNLDGPARLMAEEKK